MDKKIVEIDEKHIKVCDKFTAIQRALHECRIVGFGMADEISDGRKIRITMELVGGVIKKKGKGNGNKESSNAVSEPGADKELSDLEEKGDAAEDSEPDTENGSGEEEKEEVSQEKDPLDDKR